MDHFEKQTIYDIFRACRLCGAGGGYKMPIIQNVVDLDCDIELKQKIRECVQIEVHQNDKMPPLICELCVDKVNDFYEFLEMCRQTNKRTRLRLGLPPQILSKGVPDAGDCILGITEPIYVDDDDNEPLSRQKTKVRKHVNKEPDVKIKVKCSMTQTEEYLTTNRESRFTKSSKSNKAPSPPPTRTKKVPSPPPQPKRAPSPPLRSKRVASPPLRPKRMASPPLRLKRVSSPLRTKRVSSPLRTKRVSSPLQTKRVSSPPRPKEVPTPPLRSKRVQSPPPRAKRVPSPSPRPKRVASSPTATKGAPTPPRSTRSRGSFNEDDILLSQIQQLEKKSPRSAPKGILKKDKRQIKNAELMPPRPSKRKYDKETKEPIKCIIPAKKVSIEPVSSVSCCVCGSQFKNTVSLSNHLRVHWVSYTNPKLACNACGEWFTTYVETSLHHIHHKTKNLPYRCRHCDENFRLHQEYIEHFEKDQCTPNEEAPDVECPECWKFFPTKTLRDQHQCLGQDSRPGGKCSKCKRNYATVKSLKNHESQCTYKAKRELTVDPELLARMKPMQVRISKCDPLLTRVKQEYYDVSSVAPDFGLDKNYMYPYISSTRSLCMKKEPPEYDAMVSFDEEIKEEFDVHENYIHWDSDHSSDSENYEDSSILDINLRANQRKKVHSLSTFCLKTIFSQKFLGKVPRKRRKVKTEQNLFDSMLNTSDIAGSNSIDNIIENLANNDVVENIDKDIDGNKSDSLDAWQKSGQKRKEHVTKNNFDSLFRNQENNDKNSHINNFANSNIDNRLSDDNTTVSDDGDLGANKLYNKNDRNDKHTEDLTESEHSNPIDEENSKFTVTEVSSINFNSVDKNNAISNQKNDSYSNNAAEKEGDILIQNFDDYEGDRNSESNEETSILANYVFNNINPSPDVKNSNKREETKEENLGEKNTVDFNSHNSNIDENSLENEPKVQVDSVHNGISQSSGSERNEANDTDAEDDEMCTNNLERDENSEYSNVSEDKCNSDSALNEGTKDMNKDTKTVDTENDLDNRLCNVDLSNNVNSNAVNKDTVEDISSDFKNESEKSVNGDTEKIKFNLDDLENISDVEMDDKRLMEALDEQIGDINDTSETNSDAAKDLITESIPEKITLEDLIPKENTELKSMDLDNISDTEFDFDT